MVRGPLRTSSLIHRESDDKMQRDGVKRALAVHVIDEARHLSTGHPQLNPRHFRSCPLVAHRTIVLGSTCEREVFDGEPRMRRRRGQRPVEPSETPGPAPDRTFELDEIDEQIARLFDLVTQGLAAATAAFLSADVVTARKVASADVVIDELHLGTEALVQRQLLMATSGIDADGLARLVLALRIMPELERSGDLVEHIAARASSVLLTQLTDHARSLIRDMGALAIELWRRAGDSFTGGDAPTISELRLLDDELDDLHVQLCTELADADISVPAAIEMGLVGRFFERLGDHAVNVARRVDTEVQNPFALAGPA